MKIVIGNTFVDISPKNIHIHDSYKIKKEAGMNFILDHILALDDSILKTRSRKSIIREWKAHNICYNLGLFRKSAQHTDIEAKQSLFHKICYFILSLFYWK